MDLPKPINTKVHAVLDYATGLVLILAPDLLQFSEIGGAAVLAPRIIGLGIILLEMITDFELSLVKLVPMKVHIIVDILAGVLLALSPYLFGFNDEKVNAWLPHMLVGVMIIGVSMLSQNRPNTTN